MDLSFQNLRIRNAAPEDAALLSSWWNDGRVMAHAGFPNGLGTSAAKVVAELEGQNDQSGRICIILQDELPIGELCYRAVSGENAAEIGIKICRADKQNHGLGKQVLSLLIQELFSQHQFSKIKLDTNLNNLRAQHVYEQLGFQKTNVLLDSWTDQLGQLQSCILYELTPEQFVSFL